MNETSSVLIFNLCLTGASGVLGCMAGMAFLTRRLRRMVEPAEVVTLLQPGFDSDYSGSPSRDELESILTSLGKINSQIDARVGQHTVRVGELNDSLENGSPDDRELLVRTAKLLVAANQQLQADLAAAEMKLLDQRELAESFKHESRTDALTELLNRRAFDDEINAHLAKFKREGKTFSLLFVDIDHFKTINDQHGHLNGDQVLLTVAQCLKSSLRVPASVSRYGGEEFAVILPGVSGRNSMKIAEQLRRAVERCPHCVEGTQLRVTVSIGVTQAFRGDTRSELIERSDQALFAAKNGGRNRCYENLQKNRSPISTTAHIDGAQTAATMRA